MVAGVVAAVGAELVIAHPLAHSRPAWVAVILGGPALFLAGRAQFEYDVFARVYWDWLIGLLTLAALTPPMLLVPPLPNRHRSHLGPGRSCRRRRGPGPRPPRLSRRPRQGEHDRR
jgi:hypothetical protein